VVHCNREFGEDLCDCQLLCLIKLTVDIQLVPLRTNTGSYCVVLAGSQDEHKGMAAGGGGEYKEKGETLGP